MARIRSIHPGIWTDEHFVSVSESARLFYLGLLTESDDHGAFKWAPVTLKMRLAPAGTVNAVAVLDELCAAGMIRRYEVDGVAYGAVRNFRRFQRPERPHPIHPMPDEIRCYVGVETTNHTCSAKKSPPCGGDDSPTQLRLLTDSSVKCRADGIGIGEVSKKEIPSNAAAEPAPTKPRATPVDHFEGFWKAYPRRVGKEAARRAFAKALKIASVQQIASGLNRYVWPSDPSFIPHPATWLNQGRWSDENGGAPVVVPPRPQNPAGGTSAADGRINPETGKPFTAAEWMAIAAESGL